MRLSEPIYGSERTITADWFSGIQLVENLETNKLPCATMIKANRLGIPLVMKVTNTRAEGSSLCDFAENSNLVSFVPKKKKMFF